MEKTINKIGDHNSSFCIILDDVHGTDGPLNVDPNRFAPLYKEWMDVGKEMGFKVKDPNGVGQDECTSF